MTRDEGKTLLSRRTLYGIPLRVSANAPTDCIAVSPEVMKEIEERGTTLQSRSTEGHYRRSSDDLVSTTEHAHHSH
jgi:hypothetical protein